MQGMSQSDEETSYNEYIPLALHLSDEYFVNNASRWGLTLRLTLNTITT